MPLDLNGIMSVGKTYDLFRVFSLMLLIFCMGACADPHGLDFNIEDERDKVTSQPDRVVSEEDRKVCILYSMGFNSLSSFLSDDINDLKKGWLPGDRRVDDVLLVYSHLPHSRGKFSTRTSPVLMRIYEGRDGNVMTDTLAVYPKDTASTSAMQFSEVLGFVRDEFPAKGYGLIVSSHATGWLPAGYYANSEKYESGELKSAAHRFSVRPYQNAVPYVEPVFDPSLPLTKSIGQDVYYIGEERFSFEMSLPDFADAIPMHLDYILFDACLMGGIEVAYQLKDVCSVVGFSQAEVLAEGFDYTSLTSHLLLPDDPQPENVCKDYFKYYEAQSGIEQSATISIVDCNRLDPLAEICSVLFEKYSDKIASLLPKNVQRYYRDNYHWFYDLESILVEAGINEQEHASLREALDETIIYKAATKSFMGDFDINTFSGFSMLLPSHAGDYIRNYYKRLEWNKDTGLVR